VILGGGTGSPFFTTDTAAVLRAIELKCDAVLKATQVDGVYSDDPKKNPKAIRYDVLSHDEAITKDLKVMDTAAFALARENKLTILVGSCHAPATIKSILQGTSPATRVTP
jgi:uridylate kinase